MKGKLTLGALALWLALGPVAVILAQSHSVTVTFTPATTATSYNLYRTLTSGTEGPTPYMTGIKTSPITDNNVTAGTTYFYKMTTIVGTTESAMSNETSCTIPTNVVALPPTGVSCKGN